MTRTRHRQLAEDLSAALSTFERLHPLPGISDPSARESFLHQLIDSVRRTEYPALLQRRGVSPHAADPTSKHFHPLKAAIHKQATGDTDEAFWFVFLFVHFGKHHRAGWRYARDIYGALGSGAPWTWAATSADPLQFRVWLHEHEEEIRSRIPHAGFGNHRKYESLDAWSRRGTGAAFETYVQWISPPRTHQELMDHALTVANGDSRAAFNALYRSMGKSVASFGRLACLDYLATIGKMELAPVEPDSAYLSSATGPLTGARLLFGGAESPSVLNRRLLDLDTKLNVGQHALEDALCNWQKSPSTFRKFSA